VLPGKHTRRKTWSRLCGAGSGSSSCVLVIYAGTFVRRFCPNRYRSETLMMVVLSACRGLREADGNDANRGPTALNPAGDLSRSNLERIIRDFTCILGPQTLPMETSLRGCGATCRSSL